VAIEILRLCLLKGSEELFERSEKLFLLANQEIFVYCISPFSNKLKIVEIGRFVEWILLYKMLY